MNEKYPADWEKRRLTIFKRDQWECRGCGFVPDEKDGSELHAHHVKPISEGGGHSLDNLITLCEECHVDIHSSSQSAPLTPIETYDCVECPGEFIEGNGYNGSFCSKQCWLSFRAEKAIKEIANDRNICFTCFSEFSSEDKACSNCGNWDPMENMRAELDDVEIDVKNLVAEVIDQQQGRR